jgi:hypothetical protein
MIIEVPQPPDAFGDAADYMKASWRLGYHDGYAEIQPRIGEATLAALTVEIWDHENQLGIAKSKEDRAREELRRATDDLVPSYGHSKIAAPAWIVIIIYILFGIGAAFAEYELAGLTIAEALGHVDKESIEPFQRFIVFALAFNLVAIPFSFKLLVDAIEQQKLKAWRSLIVTAMAILCCTLCASSLYEAAELREAVGKEVAILQENGGTLKIGNLTDAQVADLKGNSSELEKSSGLTFRLLSLAIPCFSAVCFLTAFHQARDYQKHNLAVEKILILQAELPPTTDARVKLEDAISVGLRYRKKAEENKADFLEVENRAFVVFRHGYKTGQIQRLVDDGKERLYTRLVAKLNQGRYSL